MVSRWSAATPSNPNSLASIFAAMSMPPLMMTHLIPASWRADTVSCMPPISGMPWNQRMRSLSDTSGLAVFHRAMSLRMNSSSSISWLRKAL